MSKRISQLDGLGMKSQEMLEKIGIFTEDDLINTGAVRAFIKLCQSGVKPSLNLLYAMVGALEGEHWSKIAKEERSRLLVELDSYHQFNDSKPR